MGAGGGGGGGGMNSLETSLISPSKFQTGLEGSAALIPHSGGGLLVIPGLLFTAEEPSMTDGERTRNTAGIH